MQKISRPGSKTLFVIRGKLGDTLAAWPSVALYAKRHPEEKIVLAVRRNYAFLLSRETAVRLLPFASSGELFLRVLWERLNGGIARLAVLWGFGKPVARLARLSGAPLRAYLDTRFGSTFNMIADESPNERISDAAWRVARLFDQDLPRPDQLGIPSLVAARRRHTQSAICLAPVADEARRCMDRPTLEQLIAGARQRFPDAPLWLLGNPDDQALAPLLATPLPEGVSLKPFPQLAQLVDALEQCRHLLTTDTGVYHLAASLGVPCTLFFGPTQPEKNTLPAQSEVAKLRLAPLGNRHCEIKTCHQPVCLHRIVSEWSDSSSNKRVPVELPSGCLLQASSLND